MRDMTNRLNVAKAFEPKAAVAADTAQVSTICDLAGADSATLVLITGTNADADATFALTMDEGNVANLSDAVAVPTGQLLIGTLAGGGFTFADDYEVRKIGYVGNKRYIRATITPSGNTGGTLFLAGVWITSGLRYGPPAFPS